VGNRSVIVIESKQFVSPIAFYGHWSGSDNVRAVENVLARTDRVGDPSYLTAQLFHEFSTLGGYDGKLSFGIDAFGYEVDRWEDNAPIYLNADTGEKSDAPFRICESADESKCACASPHVMSCTEITEWV
jgi:hypothetical protein